MPLPPSLAATLNPAYSPCPHLTGACKGLTWKPERGFVPRGYFGTPRRISDIELFMVLAEPSDPLPGEDHSWIAGCADVASAMADRMTQSFLNRNSVFSRNLAFILERCWAPLDAETAIQQTWITESVLCSAEYPCAPVRSAATCTSNYLIHQLRLFPGAFVVALGRKAQDRLRSLGYDPAYVPSPAKPSGNWHSSKRAWEQLGTLFQEWRKRPNQAMQRTAPRSDA
jgi:hypothetical protein